MSIRSFIAKVIKWFGPVPDAVRGRVSLPEAQRILAKALTTAGTTAAGAGGAAVTLSDTLKSLSKDVEFWMLIVFPLATGIIAGFSAGALEWASRYHDGSPRQPASLENPPTSNEIEDIMG